MARSSLDKDSQSLKPHPTPYLLCCCGLKEEETDTQRDRETHGGGSEVIGRHGGEEVPEAVRDDQAAGEVDRRRARPLPPRPAAVRPRLEEGAGVRRHQRRARGSSAGCPALCADDGGASAPDVETVQLPLSAEDLHFAQVYRFVGGVFGSGAPRPVEAQLQRLLGADPVIVDTILRVLANLQDNFSL